MHSRPPAVKAALFRKGVNPEESGSDLLLGRGRQYVRIGKRRQDALDPLSVAFVEHGYITREDADEGSADLRRGLALLAIESLHGVDLSDLAGGDRLSPEQLAFYVADDFWPGRDDRPIEDWADIRRIREQVMFDAVDLTGSERSDALAFSRRFIERHPTLIHEAEWALRVVGSGEGFTDDVWAATGADDL
jgi:hypothetical protein